MNLQAICEQYAAFRKTLGERFETNGCQLKAFCRAMGPNIDIAEVSPEKVNTFLVGKGPLTTSWYVRHNALLGFYRYAISRGLVATSPLPLAVPKQLPAFQPYIYSPVELRRILDSIGSCRRRRSHLDAPTMRCLVLLMYGAALRTSEALSLTIGDVDLSCGVLTVRDSKFFKTRLVPIGPKTVQMLAEHGSRRERCSRRPTHRSLWGGTQDPSPFTYLRELSNRFGSMRVCTAQAVLAINRAFMTSVIHRQFIGSPRGIEKARTYRNSCHNCQSTWATHFWRPR